MNFSKILTFVGVALAVWLIVELLERHFSKGFAKRRVKKLLADVTAGRPPKQRKYNFEITSDPAGFSVAALEGHACERRSMKWSEVQKATAFKRDIFTYDLICLFLAYANGSGVELDEEMKGWSEFAEELPKHLPNRKPSAEWFSQVAFPAFATNATEIFSKRDTQPDNSVQAA